MKSKQQDRKLKHQANCKAFWRRKKRKKKKKFTGYIFPVWSLFISNISKILEVSLLFQKR